MATKKKLDLPADVNQKDEITITILGSVDSGKSSLCGILTNPLLQTNIEDNLEQTLDDGNGKSRAKVMQFIHEQESGRTSSVSYNYMLLNKGTPEQRIISLVDLCGHEQYLKTTIKGISSSYPDYAFVCIDKITAMTKEHIQMVVNLDIPLCILMTKMDMQPIDKYQYNLNKIKKILKKYNKKLLPIAHDSELGMDYAESNFCPIFQISNKSGAGILLLIKFLNTINKKLIKIPNAFLVDHVFAVPGFGLIVSGVSGIDINKGGDLLIGPFENDVFHKVKIRTIHDDYRNFIDTLNHGRRGCLCIRINDKYRHSIRSGMIIVRSPNDVKLSKQFMAKVFVFHNPMTISIGTSTYFNAPNIKETVIFKDIISEDENKVMRGGSKAIIKAEFQKFPYVLLENQRFLFRENGTLGVGMVLPNI